MSTDGKKPEAFQTVVINWTVKSSLQKSSRRDVKSVSLRVHKWWWCCSNSSRI